MEELVSRAASGGFLKFGDLSFRNQIWSRMLKNLAKSTMSGVNHLWISPCVAMFRFRVLTNIRWMLCLSRELMAHVITWKHSRSGSVAFTGSICIGTNYSIVFTEMPQPPLSWPIFVPIASFVYRVILTLKQAGSTRCQSRPVAHSRNVASAQKSLSLGWVCSEFCTNSFPSQVHGYSSSWVSPWGIPKYHSKNCCFFSAENHSNLAACHSG